MDSIGRAATHDAPVRVSSEVGRLRRVLVHEPGAEVDQMVPSMMEELLFDDILFGSRARDEHRRFRRVLQLLGVEVLEAQELLARALADPEGRRWVEERIFPDLLPAFRERFAAMTPTEAAQALVGGVRREGRRPALTLDELFGIRPLPNWCFQRDTQVVLGEAVLFSTMANPVRQRETTLSRAIFRFHPRLRDTTVLGEAGAGAGDGEPEGDRASLEGGDVLVLSPDVVVVGQSERTSERAIRTLARWLHRREGGPRWLLQVEVPRRRAYMHLDTLFTPVDRDAALVFPPVILPSSPDTAPVAEYDLHAADLEAGPAPDLLAALKRRGLDYEPVACGGSDPMDQQREQWTDGANALALAPGVAVLYDRNPRTADEMASRGFRVVLADDLLLGSEEVSLEEDERVCILTPSHELSRARGGPHCLTHPLERDPA